MSSSSGRSLFEAIGICFSKYAVFQGRAPRSEYWWWTLFIIVIAIVMEGMLLPHMMQNMAQYKETGVAPAPDGSYTILGLVFSLFSLATLLPSIAVTVRRLHDLNKSGWWYFFPIVPIIGPIMMLIWFCMRGTRGANRFGADPLQGY